MKRNRIFSLGTGAIRTIGKMTGLSHKGKHKCHNTKHKTRKYAKPVKTECDAFVAEDDFVEDESTAISATTVEERDANIAELTAFCKSFRFRDSFYHGLVNQFPDLALTYFNESCDRYYYEQYSDQFDEARSNMLAYCYDRLVNDLDTRQTFIKWDKDFPHILDVDADEAEYIFNKLLDLVNRWESLDEDHCFKVREYWYDKGYWFDEEECYS